MNSLGQAISKSPVAMLAAGLALGAVTIMAVPGLAPASPAPTYASPVLYDEQTVVGLYEAASPATVEITVRGARTGRGFETGQGSGFLVDAEGRILTNYHVVEGSSSVQVAFPGGRTLTGRVVSTDPAEDLAVVQVDAGSVAGITPLPLGDSSQVKPGQMAVALGSPYGLETSVTVGVISGVNRTIRSVASRPITGALQTDASINPGNSGGPLLDSSGRVVGINTAIEATSSGASSGVGFAVPINTAKEFLASVRDGSTAASIRPWLGISGTPITPGLTQSLGLTAERGVYLVSVVSGSPADRAGLIGGSRAGSGGDVITAIDGASLSSVEDLVAQLNRHRPGDAVTLNIVRNGQDLSVTVTLGEWPA